MTSKGKGKGKGGATTTVTQVAPNSNVHTFATQAEPTTTSAPPAPPAEARSVKSRKKQGGQQAGKQRTTEDGPVLPDSELCEFCDRWVPRLNMPLHLARCERAQS